ncbi:MAG: HNH endonuclease signature motif containing protein [Cyanobacteria bacterium P01_D01_bin.36]
MSTFENLVRELLQVTKRVDKSLLRLKESTTQIQKKYEPRTEFDRWKQTLGGRKWKRQQYQVQEGRCVGCQRSISLKGSHIDHIKPLSRYPELAIAPHNLRILCADCNLSKGTEEILNL